MIFAGCHVWLITIRKGFDEPENERGGVSVKAGGAQWRQNRPVK